MFCIQCGQQLENDSQFCVSCGAKAPAPENQSAGDNFCIQCGEKLLDDSQFCTSCGTKVDDNPSTIDSDAVEDWLKETAAPVEDTKPKPAKPPAAVSPKQEIPLSPKPAVRQARQAQDKKVSTDVSPSDTDPNKQRKQLIIFAGVTVALLTVVIGLIIFIVSGRDSHGPDHISRVQQGHLLNHTDITIGVAFERFFDNFEWTYFYDEDTNYVSFHGTMERDGEDIMTQFIFQFTNNDENFEIIVLVLGGVMQDRASINNLVDYIFARTR